MIVTGLIREVSSLSSIEDDDDKEVAQSGSKAKIVESAT